MGNCFELPFGKWAVWRRCRDAAEIQLAELQTQKPGWSPAAPQQAVDREKSLASEVRQDLEPDNVIRWFCLGCGAQLIHHPNDFGHCFRCNPDAAR